MSSDRETGRKFSYRPLGYDLRLTGPRADADRLARGLHWRPGLVAASYDSNVAPPMFVPPGEPAEPFQTRIEPGLISDPYFTTFGLFRSAREAISFIPEREQARDFQLWYFALIWPQTPPEGIFAGILRAMQGEDVTAPDLPVERLGYEVLDGDGASITHIYNDPGAAIDPARPGDEADRLARSGDWLLAIDRVLHAWWLPETPETNPVSDGV